MKRSVFRTLSLGLVACALGAVRILGEPHPAEAAKAGQAYVSGDGLRHGDQGFFSRAACERTTRSTLMHLRQSERREVRRALWPPSPRDVKGTHSLSAAASATFTGAVLNDGSWHHYLLSVGNGGSSISVDAFRDGTLITTSTSTGVSFSANSGNVMTLARQPAGAVYFSGRLDDVRVYRGSVLNTLTDTSLATTLASRWTAIQSALR
jgi:hypothetical protein